MRMTCYSVMTQAYSEKEIPRSPNRSRTYDLPITSSIHIEIHIENKNGPFPSCCEPHYESEARCTAFHMKITM